MRRTRLLTGLAAASLIAVPVAANAHGGGAGGPGGLSTLACEVPASAKTAVSSSTTVTRIKARLDARVAAGTITRAQADERLDDFVTQVALRNIVDEARLAPLAKLLGMSTADIKKARSAGTLRETIESKNLTDAQLRTARDAGRTAAQAKLTELCGEDFADFRGGKRGGQGGPRQDGGMTGQGSRSGSSQAPAPSSGATA